MSNHSLPPCFCDGDGAQCDWAVNITMGYSRPGHVDAVSSSVGWNLDQIPQLLAQAILQASIASVNEKGAEVYAAWAQGCFDGDSPTELIARVRAMI